MKFLIVLLIFCAGVVIGLFISTLTTTISTLEPVLTGQTEQSTILPFYNIVCDKETNVEYFNSRNGREAITVRYNADGTLKQCERR